MNTKLYCWTCSHTLDLTNVKQVLAGGWQWQPYPKCNECLEREEQEQAKAGADEKPAQTNR